MAGHSFTSVRKKGDTNSRPIGAAAATIALISVHSLSTWLACRSHRIGDVIKGQSILLVDKGELQKAAMLASHISEHDLREEMRINANINRLEDVEQAFLERSGEIGIVKKALPAHAVDIRVQDGVQIVRILHE
jgi:uncharacterized membrane protein YcaP (DUF421 family)